MVSKYPLCPERVRKIPKQFSWVDHRLVRDRYIESLSHPAASLYLFLLTVADCQGLSYYGDASIEKRLSMDAHTLQAARENLIRTGLIAWKRPIYQVLDMEVSRMPEMTEIPRLPEIRLKQAPNPDIRVKKAQPEPLGQILKQFMGGLAHD